MKLPFLSHEVTASRYAYFGDMSGSRTGLKVLLAGRERCLPGYRVQRAGFSGYGVEFVAEGTGQVVLDGRAFPLFPGVVFCYGPKTSQDISSDPECPMTKYFADFAGREALQILRRNGLHPGTAVQISNMEPPRFFFEQLISQNEVDGEAAMEGAVCCLRLIILRARKALSPDQPASTCACFSRWRAYIDENYLRIRNLEQMARELNTRPSQICRVFQQFGQPGPFHYLTRRKLNRAVELLVGEHLSVHATALAVGYDDPYHFSRLFKQHFGRSPANFLKLAGRAEAISA